MGVRNEGEEYRRGKHGEKMVFKTILNNIATVLSGEVCPPVPPRPRARDREGHCYQRDLSFNWDSEKAIPEGSGVA